MLMQKRQADDTVAQAAWLYYVGNLSQQDVSKRLGISRFKVLRMLADAREQGLVRIMVEHRTSSTLALADQLVQIFGLQEAQVAPVGAAKYDDSFARDAVAVLASGDRARIAGTDCPVTVGVGWGRTLSKMADNLTGVRNNALTFVSLMGSVTHASHTAPGDVCVRLAEQTGGRAILMPAPFIMDSADACAGIMSQRLVREALNVAKSADHALMSVGECQNGAILFDSDIFDPEQIEELRAVDVVGDCCGVFYKADGSVADIELNRCTPCVQPVDMASMNTVMLAGGMAKLDATRAILRAGFIKKLLVDEALARALVAASHQGRA